MPPVNEVKVSEDSPVVDHIEESLPIVNPYSFDFSQAKFCRILVNPDEVAWYEAMYNVIPKYNITTVERVSGFLAQTCHESMDYTVITENLNYSAQGLHRTFPRRFPTVSSARPYHRKPQMIANKIYGGRMGNTSPDDGWKFRGRGPIMITGKYNYTECSKFLFNDLRLVNDPDLILRDKKVCIMSACWYWETRSLNRSCDRKDIATMTKLINGGLIGLADRRVRFNKALNILKS